MEFVLVTGQNAQINKSNKNEINEEQSDHAHNK